MDLNQFLEIIAQTTLLNDTEKNHLYTQAPFMLAFERSTVAQDLRGTEQQTLELIQKRDNIETEIFKEYNEKIDQYVTQTLPKKIKKFEADQQAKDEAEADNLLKD